MLRSLSALVLFASLVTAAQEPIGYEHTPVAVPPAMKSALARKVTLKAAEGTPVEFLTKLAADNKLKIDFSPALTKEHEELLKGKGKVVAQGPVRLDIILHQFLTDAGITPVCVIKDDVLVFTTESDPDAAAKNKKPIAPGAVVVTTVRQPPDSSHATIVSVLRRKMTEKTDFDAMNNVPLSAALAALTKQTGIPYPIHRPSFAAAGIEVPNDTLVTIKGGKMVTYDAVLKEALAFVGGVFYVDPYGSPSVVHKDDRRVKAKK